MAKKKKCDICGKEFESEKGLKIHKSKKHKDKGEKTRKKATKSNREKEIKIVVGVMVSIILIVLLVFLIGQSQKNFEYNGLEFKERQMGEITYYDTHFLVRTNDRSKKRFKFSFRNDPRELKNITVEGNIVLNKNVGLAADSDLICENNNLALMTLSINFFDRLGIDTFSGTTNKTLAERYNKSLLRCNDTRYSVLSFRKGNKTRIVREGDCYRIYVNDCQIMEVSEKFMIDWYEGYKERVGI